VTLAKRVCHRKYNLALCLGAGVVGVSCTLGSFWTNADGVNGFTPSCYAPLVLPSRKSRNQRVSEHRSVRLPRKLRRSSPASCEEVHPQVAKKFSGKNLIHVIWGIQHDVSPSTREPSEEKGKRRRTSLGPWADRNVLTVVINSIRICVRNHSDEAVQRVGGFPSGKTWLHRSGPISPTP
jgi:hypothetical protein